MIKASAFPLLIVSSICNQLVKEGLTENAIGFGAIGFSVIVMSCLYWIEIQKSKRENK